jgi:hypothetical protein
VGALGQLWEGPVPGYAAQGTQSSEGSCLGLERLQGTRYRVRWHATAGTCPVGLRCRVRRTSGGWLPRLVSGARCRVRGAGYAGTLQWVMP